MDINSVRKVKYLYILEILKQDSDVDKPISTNELLEKLKKRGVHVDRKILYNDIDVLNEAGYEIMCVRQKQNLYYIADRKFDIPELRILMDAASAATFISEGKTQELLVKIAELGGSHRKELMLRNNSYFDTNKHSNPHTYYTINEIEEGINTNKKITFKYFDLNYKAEKVYRKNGEKYEVNPIATIFSNDNYYLVTTNDKYEGYANYRIDRIEDCRVTEKQRTKPKDIEEFSLNTYRKKHFGMYIGKTETVTLEFENELTDIIFDKFGENTKITLAESKSRVSLEVSVSNPFFGFLCGLSNKIEIISPKWVVEEYKNHLKKAINKYEGNKNE